MSLRLATKIYWRAWSRQIISRNVYILWIPEASIFFFFVILVFFLSACVSTSFKQSLNEYLHNVYRMNLRSQMVMLVRQQCTLWMKQMTLLWFTQYSYTEKKSWMHTPARCSCFWPIDNSNLRRDWKIHRMTSDWHWTLNCQKYPEYSKYLPPKP